MPEDRTQLYKIRRLIRRNGREVYEWYQPSPDGQKVGPCIRWVDLEMDAYAFTRYATAVIVCDQIKTRYRHPDALYHVVVPA